MMRTYVIGQRCTDLRMRASIFILQLLIPLIHFILGGRQSKRQIRRCPLAPSNASDQENTHVPPS